MTDQEQRKLEYEYALAMGAQNMLLKLKDLNPADGRYGKCVEFALVQTTFLVNDMDRVVMAERNRRKSCGNST